MEIEILVTTGEQLNTVLEFSFYKKIRLFVESFLLEEVCHMDIDENKVDLFAALPYVLLNQNRKKLQNMLEKEKRIKGLLIRNLEELAFCNELYKDTDLEFILDSGFQIYNSESFQAAQALSFKPISEIFGCFEISGREHDALYESISDRYPDIYYSYVVHGHIPMMISQNCVRKTKNQCSQERGFSQLTDRLNKTFKVLCCCDFCYNVIYNSVPLYLAPKLGKIKHLKRARVDFTVEDSKNTFLICRYYNGLDKGEPNILPDFSFSLAHYESSVL